MKEKGDGFLEFQYKICYSKIHFEDDLGLPPVEFQYKICYSKIGVVLKKLMEK